MRKTFYRLVNILTTLFMIITMAAAPPPQQAAAAVIDVAYVMLPVSQTVNLSESFNVTVQVQAGANVVDGVTICVDFDPAILQFEAFHIPETDPWEAELPMVTHDPANGKADHTRATWGDGTVGTTDFVIIQFKALAVSVNTSISFHLLEGRNTEVSVSGSIYDCTALTGSTVQVTPGTQAGVENTSEPSAPDTPVEEENPPELTEPDTTVEPESVEATVKTSDNVETGQDTAVIPAADKPSETAGDEAKTISGLTVLWVIVGVVAFVTVLVILRFLLFTRKRY